MTNWTHAEPFDAVVLTLAAGFALLILASFAVDWFRYRRLRRKLSDAQHDLVELSAVMVEAGLIVQQTESDNVEGVRQW